MNRRNLILLAPLGIAGAAGIGFFAALERMRRGTFDPHSLPSPLVGKPLPNFVLPGQAPAQFGFSSDEVRAAGRPVLINFFASWCVPCALEHDELMQLSRSGVALWGIAYKDKPEAALEFLREHGDPFARLAADRSGRTAINFGVYGVPETYLVDRTGIVRWRWAGPITPEVAADTLKPLLHEFA